MEAQAPVKFNYHLVSSCDHVPLFTVHFNYHGPKAEDHHDPVPDHEHSCRALKVLV